MPVTVTASIVVAAPGAAKETSTPAPARTSTRRVPISRSPRITVSVYSPTGRVLKLYLPEASDSTVRLKPLLLLAMTLTPSPSGTTPYTLPVVLCACTAPAKHRPRATQSALRLIACPPVPEREKFPCTSLSLSMRPFQGPETAGRAHADALTPASATDAT